MAVSSMKFIPERAFPYLGQEWRGFPLTFTQLSAKIPGVKLMISAKLKLKTEPE
jgi:hypothetical protein